MRSSRPSQTSSGLSMGGLFLLGMLTSPGAHIRSEVLLCVPPWCMQHFGGQLTANSHTGKPDSIRGQAENLSSQRAQLAWCHMPLSTVYSAADSSQTSSLRCHFLMLHSKTSNLQPSVPGLPPPASQRSPCSSGSFRGSTSRFWAAQGSLAMSAASCAHSCTEG